MTTPAPATQLVLSVDQPSYTEGDGLTLTAKYSGLSNLVIIASATDSAGNTVQTEIDVPVLVPSTEVQTVGVSDSFNDSYSLTSNDPGVAVLTTTVGAPPAADAPAAA